MKFQQGSHSSAGQISRDISGYYVKLTRGRESSIYQNICETIVDLVICLTKTTIDCNMSD
jgi:methionine salvage enolase-phosphatase E1